MSTKTHTADRTPARDRLLAAAAELFYKEGVNSVGIDRVIERAGVAKASLYSNFESKDDLIRAYLDQRQEARQARIQKKLAAFTEPRDKLLAIFDVLGEVFAQPDFRGCAFLRASAEMRSGNGARNACDDYRKWVRALFADLAKEAGAADPAELAGQLVLLYDGASVSAQMDRAPRAAALARSVAEQLLVTACPKRNC
jgi:AcrR family transcriptional regulator